MVVKASLGGLNARESLKLRSEIDEASNSRVETMEEYAKLIRLVRQGFGKKHGRRSDSA